MIHLPFYINDEQKGISKLQLRNLGVHSASQTSPAWLACDGSMPIHSATGIIIPSKGYLSMGQERLQP